MDEDSWVVVVVDVDVWGVVVDVDVEKVVVAGDIWGWWWMKTSWG